MAQAVGQLGGAVGAGSLSWYASGPRLRPLWLSVLCPFPAPLLHAGSWCAESS